MMLRRLSIFMLIFIPDALAIENTAPDVKKLLCHGPHEERTLEIVNKGAGCVLIYKKQKEEKEVAHAQNSVNPCKQAMQKIRERLESGNFACE